MIYLKTRSSYSFRQAFAPIDKLVAKADSAMAITDNGGTWGHISFYKECNKKGVKPILGVALNVVMDATVREKQNGVEMVFLARNQKGLRQVYDITSVANQPSNFYYVPRISYSDLNDIGDDCFVLTGINPQHVPNKDHFIPEYNIQSEWYAQQLAGAKGVATGDNYFVDPSDEKIYNTVCKMPKDKTTPMWLVSDEEYLAFINNPDALRYNREIADDCSVHLPLAKFVEFDSPKSLQRLCIDSAEDRGIKLSPSYMTRLLHELDIIKQKNFENYFFVVADMVRWAKQRMIVGPARGSAAGSLVSYCLGITEVDPIQHELIFERFIDINRDDLPDIDLDFPITERESVIQYLKERYGQDRVGRIGTVGVWSDQITLVEVSKALGLPFDSIQTYKESIGTSTINSTLFSTATGKDLLRRHPEMGMCVDIEGTPKQSGVHAAGVVVSNTPIREHCSIDRNGTINLDKNDAETLGLVKLDILGLRTLTVIDDCLNQIGKDVEYLLGHPVDDEKVFQLFNDGKLSGIFQFDGEAVKKATRDMGAHSFDDLVHLTTIVRPGPSQSMQEFFARHAGDSEPKPLHPTLEHITKETYGILLYQEQLMEVCRASGMSWPEVSDVRRLMSKSKGFDKYREKFVNGFDEISHKEAGLIWDKLVTFGQYAFNKSHAVSYSMISYWCAVLKAYHPLEFFVACLRNPKGEEETIRTLRELVSEGFTYEPVSTLHLNINWEVINGKITGGLINIKGMAEKKALNFRQRILDGVKLTPSQMKHYKNPETPYDDIFKCKTMFQCYYDDPRGAGLLLNKIWLINEIQSSGTVVFLGKVTDKKLREKNGKAYMSLLIEDDTGIIPLTVMNKNFKKYGEVEEGKYYVFKGKYVKDYHRVFSESRMLI